MCDVLREQEEVKIKKEKALVKVSDVNLFVEGELLESSML